MNVIIKTYAKFARIVDIIGHPIKILTLKGTKRTRVIVCTQDSILLQRTSVGSQRWNVPGGGIKSGETAIEAAQREVLEEVGITLEKTDLKEIGSSPQYGPNNKVQYERVFLIAKLKQQITPKITRPLEILEARWFLFSELPEERSDTVDVALLMAGGLDQITEVR